MSSPAILFYPADNPSQTDNPSLVKNGQCEVKGLIEVAQRFGKECLVVLPNQITTIGMI